jgi:DNA-binding MarR family transcriptional regulator
MPDPKTTGAAARRGPPLEARIGYLLSVVGRRQSTRFTDLLKPLGLRPKHFALMNVVDLAEGPSQQQVGEMLGLDPSGLIPAIDELEAEGLLERCRAAEDRRRHALYLTRAGRAKLTKAREAARKRGEELIAPLSEAEAETFHDFLERIARADNQDLRFGTPPRPGVAHGIVGAASLEVARGDPEQVASEKGAAEGGDAAGLTARGPSKKKGVTRDRSYLSSSGAPKATPEPPGILGQRTSVGRQRPP